MMNYLQVIKSLQEKEVFENELTTSVFHMRRQ